MQYHILQTYPVHVTSSTSSYEVKARRQSNRVGLTVLLHIYERWNCLKRALYCCLHLASIRHQGVSTMGREREKKGVLLIWRRQPHREQMIKLERRPAMGMVIGETRNKQWNYWIRIANTLIRRRGRKEWMKSSTESKLLLIEGIDFL